MKINTFITVLSLFLSIHFSNAQTKPRLVVGVVVDQMRTDYIYRYWDKFSDDGLKKLVGDGFFCRNAHYNYMPTLTAPGHASIFTGTTPMVHGIIANNWYDRKTSKEIYCVDDESTKSVGVSNANGKKSPVKCLAPGLGDAIRLSSNFQGKSIGVSSKDRSAILPPGLSANAAYWFDSETGLMITSSYYMETLPKWVTQFNNQKHADKLSKDGWSPLHTLTHYTESTADNTIYEKSFIKGAEPVFPYDVSKGIKEQGYSVFTSTPFSNTYLRLFAEQAVLFEELGQDEHLDLLTLSFSAPDIIGHGYGPQSIEIEDTYLRLDLEIAELIKMLDLRVGEGNYVLFLTADHAAAQVAKYALDHKLPAGLMDDDAYHKALNEELKKQFGVDSLISNYSNQQLFLNHEIMRKQKLDVKAISEMIRSFSLDYPGISNTLDTRQLQHPLPSDEFSKLAAMGWNPQRSGDMVVQYLPGWMEWRDKGTTHGSTFNYDTHVPLIFYGYGVPKGESIEPVEITQIVPTVSLLCRIAFPDASEHTPVSFR